VTVPAPWLAALRGATVAARRVGRGLVQQPLTAVRAGVRYCAPYLPRGQYVAFSTRPVILLVKDYAVQHPRTSFLDLLRGLRRHHPHVLYCTSWHVHPGLVDQHLATIRRLERACPGAQVTVLGQTATETALFAARGVATLYCNQNSLADERIFRPLSGMERRFGALYDAQLAPYKRHGLAGESLPWP
jgi:hypothetical protein